MEPKEHEIEKMLKKVRPSPQNIQKTKITWDYKQFCF